jgi:hypothetical protein
MRGMIKETSSIPCPPSGLSIHLHVLEVLAIYMMTVHVQRFGSHLSKMLRVCVLYVCMYVFVEYY